MTPQQSSALAYYLYTKQLTKDVAIGIVSVLQIESGLNPLAENNSGTDAGGSINPKGAYGLAQWNGARQDALQAFCVKYKFQVTDFDAQLAFVLTEAANSYPPFWSAITSHVSHWSDVISAMVSSYERPADSAKEIVSATAIATQLSSEPMPTPTPAPQPTPTPTPTPAPSGKGPLITQLVAAIAQVLQENGM